MDHVNTEQFIDEIKSRRALWDTSSDDYKNRDLKKSLWKEVCSIFYPGFDEKDGTEKLKIAKELQGKWKILRDGYSRYLRTNKTKSGRNRTSSRMYLYERQFEFLNKSKTLCTEQSPTLPEVNENDINDFKEMLDNKKSRENLYHNNVSCRSKNRKKRENLEENTGKYKDQSQATPKPEDANCDDMHFFRSLLPIIKTLPLREKIKFRMDIMKMALDYTENFPTSISAPPNYPIQYSMSQQVPPPFHNSVPYSVQHVLQSLYQMPSPEVGFQNNISNAPPHLQSVTNQNSGSLADDFEPKGLVISPEETHDSQSSSRSYISVTPDLSE